MPWSDRGTSASAASRYGPGCPAFASRGFSPRCIRRARHGRAPGRLEPCGPLRRAVASSFETEHAAPRMRGEICTMTFDDVRKIALAWPEVEDGTSYGTPALKVRKKTAGAAEGRRRQPGDAGRAAATSASMLVESQPQRVLLHRSLPRLSDGADPAVEGKGRDASSRCCAGNGGHWPRRRRSRRRKRRTVE